jgi:hypothetical protein
MILSDLERQGLAEFIGLSYADLVSLAKSTTDIKTLRKLVDFLSVRICDYNGNIQLCQTILFEARKRSLKLTGIDPVINLPK